VRKNTSQLCRSTLLCSALLISSTLLQAGELQPSNGAANDEFGFSVAVSGTIGLVGARLDDFPGPPSTTNQGAAYVFHNLHTASGTVTQNAFLLASDRASADQFGYSVSLSGNSGLIGAPFDDSPGISNHGSAYLFRNLDTASGTVTQHAKLVASDAAANDRFGISVSISGNIGVVGAYLDDILSNADQGSAYVFTNLDTASGTVNEYAKLVASDGAAGDRFGNSVSVSGTMALIGAYRNDHAAITNRGAAYVFQDLAGTPYQSAKLVASDAAANDEFGISVSLSGNMGLIGAHLDDSPGISNHGSAYLYRNLNTATGTVTQNAKLLASDAAANDRFGYSVSLSGNTGIVGAYLDDVNSNTDQGSAYIFRNLDTVTGTVYESVKIFATNGAAGDRFGISVSLDDDRFIVGASWRDIGSNINQGTAYFGHVRTFTTANLGNDTTATDGLSFEARENWIIGQTTSNNSVTLTSGDTGNVGRVGLVNPTAAQTFIGQNAGSNDNTLHIQSTATLTSNSVQVGTNGNSGNQLRINGTLNLASGASLTVAADNILSGAGTIQGHASNTSNTVIISGSLRPGSGDLGSGIATITRNDGNVTWNGNASSPWVFHLGVAQPTLAQANTGGTRDLLDITNGDFLKGMGSDFIFDFAGTGQPGWYKIVDWTGNTTFLVSDFTATNLHPSITGYSFVIDDGPSSTTALYLYLVPEPHIWWTVLLLFFVVVCIRNNFFAPLIHPFQSKLQAQSCRTK